MSEKRLAFLRFAEALNNCTLLIPTSVPRPPPTVAPACIAFIVLAVCINPEDLDAASYFCIASLATCVENGVATPLAENRVASRDSLPPIASGDVVPIAAAKFAVTLTKFCAISALLKPAATALPRIPSRSLKLSCLPLMLDNIPMLAVFC